MAASRLWWLQFGHGTEAVENAASGSDLGRGGGRFNSATALRPWKTQCAGEHESNPKRFNSATALRPWKTPD